MPLSLLRTIPEVSQPGSKHSQKQLKELSPELPSHSNRLISCSEEEACTSDKPTAEKQHPTAPIIVPRTSPRPRPRGEKPGQAGTQEDLPGSRTPAGVSSTSSKGHASGPQARHRSSCWVFPLLGACWGLQSASSLFTGPTLQPSSRIPCSRGGNWDVGQGHTGSECTGKVEPTCHLFREKKERKKKRKAGPPALINPKPQPTDGKVPEISIPGSKLCLILDRAQEEILPIWYLSKDLSHTRSENTGQSLGYSIC